MTYQIELLAQQRLAELRQAGTAAGASRDIAGPRRRSLRVSLGEVLLRAGHRLTSAPSSPATN